MVTKLAIAAATKSSTVVKQKECRKSLLSSNQKVATTIRVATKVVSIVFTRLRINSAKSSLIRH